MAPRADNCRWEDQSGGTGSDQHACRRWEPAWHRSDRKKRSQARPVAGLTAAFMRIQQHHGSQLPKLVSAALDGCRATASSSSSMRPSTSLVGPGRHTGGELVALCSEVLILRGAITAMQSQVSKLCALLFQWQEAQFFFPPDGGIPSSEGSSCSVIDQVQSGLDNSARIPCMPHHAVGAGSVSDAAVSNDLDASVRIPCIPLHAVAAGSAAEAADQVRNCCGTFRRAAAWGSLGGYALCCQRCVRWQDASMHQTDTSQ